MEKQTLFWCNFDPNRVWRAPTPIDSTNSGLGKYTDGPDATSSMMRLNNSCISLSALEQQPSGSSATIFPPSTATFPRRSAPALEDQLLVNMQNVSIFNSDMAGLGITQMPLSSNPWQPKSMSFGSISTNGFSDTSSALMSPISSPGLKKTQQNFQQRAMKNPTSHFRNTSARHHHHHSHHQQPQRFQQQTNVASRTIQLKSDEYHPGMRDLPYWLKKLRLHKYAPLFEDMTYRQLLLIDNAALERMRVTNGARKKIAQSIEKLHERPALLKSLDVKLKNGTQCPRCAICSVRQLLWSPFIKYEGPSTSRKTSSDIIDGFNVPTQMISDDNLPALIFRVIETLNHMVFPLRKQLLDLEDEYQLTMFHMFDSVMKNESFTQNQQRRAFAMKRNARNFANPEEIRRHRMGMVSSAQCESCHHAEVVNRERLMELQERQMRNSHGSQSFSTMKSCSALLEISMPTQHARLEFNVPPASPGQRIQKRPALMEDDEWLASTGSPKISTTTNNSDESGIGTASATVSSPVPVATPEATTDDNVILPKLQSGDFWANVNNIWGDDKPSTSSYRFPTYHNPEVEAAGSSSETVIIQTTDEFNEPSFNFLRMMETERLPTPTSSRKTKTPSLSDFNFPESSSASSKKANSTGSGYSSSDSDVSIITSPRSGGSEDVQPPATMYGINQILCSTANFKFRFM